MQNTKIITQLFEGRKGSFELWIELNAGEILYDLSFLVSRNT